MNFTTIKNKYLASSLLLRIIYINIAVFVLLRLVGIVSFLATGDSTTALQWVGLSSNFWLVLRRPWTLITYMFSHYGVFDILFNMLWLYWLGRIFLECFNPKQLVGLYLLGGFIGAILFIAVNHLLPHMSVNGPLVGASAAVLAIVIGISVYRPNYEIGLLFFGGIPLKWIAIATMIIYLISFDGTNMGGYVAHVGGMLTGLWFGLAIKSGHDITSWINRCIDSIVALFQKSSYRKSPKADKKQDFKFKKSNDSNKKSSSQSSKTGNDVAEDQLDAILDKLKRSGYGALSDEEKETLFKASRKREG
ncbi:MAG: rhomboid family intramembrane serine protease [Muribaculaceae bacterium]|nr:rhomboid family intramembrane serine protease [Muribaculaceae bacterium]